MITSQPLRVPAHVAGLTQVKDVKTDGSHSPPTKRFRNWRYALHALMSLLLLLVLNAAAWAGSVSFTFNLPTASTTSAGAFKADGTLIRTLWSNIPKPAGTNTASWDGLDDDGRPVNPASYQVRILAHNVTYTWQGYMGNTSTTITGPTPHRSFQAIQGMAIAGTKMYPVYGYNEKRPVWSRLSTSDPNSVAAWGTGDFSRVFNYAATDGTNVYFANVGNTNIASVPSFVTAVRTSDDGMVTFANGVPGPAPGTNPTLYPSVIDLQTGATNGPTGIAVQTSGNFLFVAHRGLNEIHILNKTSGASVGTFSITAPDGLATTTDDNLWVICTESGNRVVRRYNVDASGNFTAASVVTGLANPLAVAVSPNNNTLLIADGGTSQQVKAFSNVATGTPTSQWTLGTAGGYNATNGPDVTNTKFMFMQNWNESYAAEGTYLAFQSDGSFWLGDAGNERNLHFSSAQAYLGQIAYPTANYVNTVCNDQPTRVFSRGWLEFNVDYSQPANQGWTLVKNWTAGLPTAMTRTHQGGLCAVVEMSNGRVYGSVPYSGNRVVLELPATGPARVTTSQFPVTSALHEDGSLRTQTLTTGNATFTRQNLTGFNTSGDPQWGTATTIASTARATTDPAGNGFAGPEGRRFPTTSGGVMISSATNSGWHKYLGGINEGGTAWLWKASPASMFFDGHGSVSADCNYPANTQFVQGHNILFGCHGEGYNGGQANQFMHYWDNGLFIGQFGAPGYGNPLNSVVAGTSGNAFSHYLVEANGNLYLWCNDEWGTGVGRWLLGNSSSITELTPISVTVPATGGNGTGLTGQYFTGVNQDTLNLTHTDQTVNFIWSGSPATGVSATNYSVRWSGLVQPKYSQTYTFYTQSDDAVRLWVNGQKIIDNWVAHPSTEDTSTTIALTANQKYSILLEYYNGNGGGIAQLKWSSTSQSKGIIPMQQLYPSGTTAINCGGPAIGRFAADPNGTTGTAIITTTNAIDRTGVADPAPEACYKQQRRFNQKYNFTDLQPFSNYRVRLHVAEIVPGNFANDKRVFSVKVNNLANITPDVDPYELAGAAYKAAVQEFLVTSDSRGAVTLNFPSATYSLMAAIELNLDGSDPATSPYFALQGVGSGLKGQYYNDTNFTTLVNTRTDPEVNFAWANAGPMASVGPHNYTVRWTGKVQSVEPGTYTFSVNATNGARLWVNNVLLVDSWATSGNHSGTITLDASTQYDIKVEYLNGASSSVVSLNWTKPGEISRIIPQSQLHPAP